MPTEVQYTSDLRDRIAKAGLTTDELIAVIEGQGFVVSLPETDPHGNRWDSLTARELHARAGWCMRPAHHRALTQARNELHRRSSDAPGKPEWMR